MYTHAHTHIYAHAHTHSPGLLNNESNALLPGSSITSPPDDMLQVPPPYNGTGFGNDLTAESEPVPWWIWLIVALVAVGLLCTGVCCVCVCGCACVCVNSFVYHPLHVSVVFVIRQVIRAQQQNPPNPFTKLPVHTGLCLWCRSKRRAAHKRELHEQWWREQLPSSKKSTGLEDGRRSSHSSDISHGLHTGEWEQGRVAQAVATSTPCPSIEQAACPFQLPPIISSMHNNLLTPFNSTLKLFSPLPMRRWHLR